MFRIGWKFFIQILGIVIFLCLVILLIGWFYDKIAASYNRSPPPGKLVDVNGRKIHIYCEGKGSPTVVFDSGLGFHSLDWTEIQKEISKFTRTCSYDRLGYGWSEKDVGSRTSLDIARELHKLLENSGEKAPYILVGHAFGGLNMRLYQALYPKEVAALVLLDPSHEEMITFFPIKFKNPAQKIWDSMYLFLAKFGLHRYLSRNFIDNNFPDLPDNIKRVYQSHHSMHKTLETAYRENVGFLEGLQQMRENKVGLGSIPVIVLSSSREKLKIPNMSERELNVLHGNIIKMHQRLASSSKEGTQITLEGSGHFIHYDNLKIVVQAIKDVIKIQQSRRDELEDSTP